MKFARLVLVAAAATALSLRLAITLPSRASQPHVLRFATSDLAHLNTLLATTYEEFYPALLTAAYLVTPDAHGMPQPELARDVPSMRNGGISADGKTITYHLRPGLRWSDGSPLTAADIVFTTHLITAKNSPVVTTTGWDRIARVDRLSAQSVRFTLKAPYAPAIQQFFSRSQGYSILPEHLLRNVDLRTAPFNALPVGAGPFRYTRFARGDEIVMEANPYYFRGRPKLDRIVDKFVPSQNTVTTQIMTGEIDIALNQSGAQLVRFANRRDIGVVEAPTLLVGYLGIETTHAPLNDVRVRQALRYAIDRRRILQKIYHGRGTISDDVISASDPFFGTSIGTTQTDDDRAAELLDAAGWHLGRDGMRERHGRPLTIDLVDFKGNDVAYSVVELLRADLAKIGVTLATRTVDGATFYAPGGADARGDYGMAYYGQFLTSDALGGAFGCRAVPPHGFNSVRYCNPRVDALLDRAEHIYDAPRRTQLYREARRLIVADVPVIPIVHRRTVDGVRSGVSGFAPNAFSTFGDIMNVDVR